MSQQFTLFVPLDQPIAVFLDSCYKRHLRKYQHDLSRGKTGGINLKIEWVPLFSELIKEISARSETALRAPGLLPPSVKILMGLGYDRKEASDLSSSLLMQVVAEISLVSPEISTANLEEWNYGICEPNTLMISVPLN